MENLIRLFAIVLLAINLVACNEEPPPLQENVLSEFEQKLVGVWAYEAIQVDRTETYFLADDNSEPGMRLLTTIGKRADIARRRIRYSPEMTYQLDWIDRGNYELGTPGDPNWQPNFGSWYYVGDSTVIHNNGLDYQVQYKLFFDGRYMVRISNRYMSSSKDPYQERFWDEGDTARFVEIFTKVR